MFKMLNSHNTVSLSLNDRVPSKRVVLLVSTYAYTECD